MILLVESGASGMMVPPLLRFLKFFDKGSSLKKQIRFHYILNGTMFSMHCQLKRKSGCEMDEEVRATVEKKAAHFLMGFSLDALA